MLGKADPYITSLEEKMASAEVGRVSLSGLAQPLFEVLEFGDHAIDLDAEGYRQYVSIRLGNVIKTYSGGLLNVTSVYYCLRRCEEADFQRSEYE